MAKAQKQQTNCQSNIMAEINRTRSYLRRVGRMQDDKINLARVALHLAKLDHPGAKIQELLDHLKEIHQTTQLVSQSGVFDLDCLSDRIELLNKVIFTDYGYRGDHENYDDLENADFISVIKKRKGLPISLGILYIDLARRLKWNIHGLNFPGHFLIKLSWRDRAEIIDPFHQGKTHDAAKLRGLIKVASGLDAELKPENYAPASNRDILLRLQNNIKLRLVRSGKIQEATNIIETMLWIAPQNASVWYEGALLQARLGCFKKATEMLETSFQNAESENQKHQIYSMLQHLRQRFS